MSSIPNFEGVDLGAAVPPADSAAQFDALLHASPMYSEGWQTPEHILVPPMYD